MDMACSSPHGAAGLSQEKTFELWDLSGRSSIPAQSSKIKIKNVDAVSFI